MKVQQNKGTGKLSEMTQDSLLNETNSISFHWVILLHQWTRSDRSVVAQSCLCRLWIVFPDMQILLIHSFEYERTDPQPLNVFFPPHCDFIHTSYSCPLLFSLAHRKETKCIYKKRAAFSTTRGKLHAEKEREGRREGKKVAVNYAKHQRCSDIHIVKLRWAAAKEAVEEGEPGVGGGGDG